MGLSEGWLFEAEAVEHLGISYSVCAFPLQSSEILRAVKLCHLCDLSDSFGEGDNSVRQFCCCGLVKDGFLQGWAFNTRFIRERKKKCKRPDKQARHKLRLSRKPQSNLSEDGRVCYFYTPLSSFKMSGGGRAREESSLMKEATSGKCQALLKPTGI